MIRSITFLADDLGFIQALNNTNPDLDELSEHLKEVTSDLVADDTINLELSDDLIEQAVKVDTEDLWPDDSGIMNHIAIQFYHNEPERYP